MFLSPFYAHDYLKILKENQKHYNSSLRSGKPIKSALAKIHFLNEEDHDGKRIKGTYVDSEYFSFITLQ